MVRSSSSKRANIATFLEEEVKDPGKKAAKFILDPIPKRAKRAPAKKAIKPLPGLRGDQITKVSKEQKVHAARGKTITGGYRKRAQDIRAGRATPYNSVAKPKAQKPYKAAKTRGLNGPN